MCVCRELKLTLNVFATYPFVGRQKVDEMKAHMHPHTNGLVMDC